MAGTRAWAGEPIKARSEPGSRGGRNAWLEVTPLGSFDPPRLLSLADGSGGVRLDGWKSGLALVCTGGDDVAVECEQRYLDATSTIRPELGKGVRISGTIFVGSSPARGARVALVPRRLTSRRLLTIPLALDRKTAAVVREMRTDRAGQFTLPQLAPGEYRLEINAPGGLILHGEPFTLPLREALLPKGPTKPKAEAVFDLGRIVIPTGVQVEMTVHDPAGLPIAGAKVGGAQGDTPATTRFFEARTGLQGQAVLSGFDPAQPTSFVCSAPGYFDARQRFAVLPLTVECTMTPLSALEGRVTDTEGKPVTGTTLWLRPDKRTTLTGKLGQFLFPDLAPGSYRLIASAPGYKPERVAVDLAAGERRKLAPIALAPGREVHGRVEDGKTKVPIAGATLSAIDPPGAVASESGEDGTFDFNTDDAQGVVLSVRAAGYPAKTVEVPRREIAPEAPWTIDLTPGGRIRAQVWDEEADGPCQGCSLTLTGPAGEEPQTIVTDGQGGATSEPLAEGVYAVSPVKVQSLGWVVQVSGGDDIKRVEVRADETAVVRFGERRRRVVVRLHPNPIGWQLVATAATRSGVAEVLADGSRQVVKPDGEAVRLTLVRERANVELGVLAAADDHKVFDLDVPQTEVNGAVRGEPASPSIRLVSMLDPSIYASAPLPADGRFSIPFLPPGLYSLLVNGHTVRSLSVRPDSATDLGEVELK